MMFPLFSTVSTFIVSYLFKFCERQTERIIFSFNLMTLCLEVLWVNLGTD